MNQEIALLSQVEASDFLVCKPCLQAQYMLRLDCSMDLPQALTLMGVNVGIFVPWCLVILQSLSVFCWKYRRWEPIPPAHLDFEDCYFLGRSS